MNRAEKIRALRGKYPGGGPFIDEVSEAKIHAFNMAWEMIERLKIIGYSVDFNTAKRMALRGIEEMIKNESDQSCKP